MKRMPDSLSRAAAAIAVALAAAVTAFGQQSPPPTGSDAERARIEAERRRLERERILPQMNLRIVESEGPKRHSDESQPMRLDIQQILEDFKLLQVVSRNLMTIASQGQTLNLKEVEKSTSEIKKRAGRLSANLVLPKSEKGGKRGAPEVLFDEAELKRSVATLDELIDGFAHNPVFREVNLVDANLSAKARRDLDEIIALSDRMKKSCEQLNKAARRNQ